MPGRTTTVAGHTLDRASLAMIATLALGVFAGALDLGVLSPALPAIARQFGVGAREVAWVLTLYLFANVVSIPIATKLSDRYGRRRVYSLCVAIFAAGSVAAIVAPTYGVFLVARAVQAAGAGGIFPVATAAIADRIPQERRGSALGILGAIWGLAAIVGPNFGAVMTRAFSWHWIFAANVPLAVIVIVLARRHVPTLAAKTRGPLDVAGVATLALGLLGVMVGLTQLDPAAARLGLGPVVCGLAVAAVCFAILPRIEARAAAPMISPRLFANPQLAKTYVLELFVGLLEGALFFIPAALVAAERLSVTTAGAVAAIGAFMFVAVIPLAGRALDRYGSRTVLIVGAVLTAVGLGTFALALATLPLAILGIVVAGTGFGALLGAPTRYIVANEAPPEMRSAAIGLLSIFLIMGQIVGGSLAGGIIGARIDDPAGYRHAYAAFVAVAVLALLLASRLASREAERAAVASAQAHTPR